MAEITKIILKNWMGFKGEYEYNLEKITALIAPNGSGKTSLLLAIRFALTGEKPDGDMINSDSDEASVAIEVSGKTGIRIFRRDVSNSGETEKVTPYVDDKKVLVKVYDEEISRAFEQPVENLKMFTSSEVVSAMKPQEFGDLILKYVESRFRIGDILDFYPSHTEGEEALLRENLPEDGITVEMLDKLEDELRSQRKSFKTSLQSKKALMQTLPEKMPDGSREALEDELNALSDAFSAIKLYEAKKKAYDEAVENLKTQKTREADIETKIKAITATEPDQAEKDAMQKDYNELQKSLNNNKVAFNSLKASKEQNEKTLEALEKPICPISPLIKCHENKTVAENEVSEAVKAAENGMKALKTESQSIVDKIMEIRKKAEIIAKNDKAWNEKVSLEKELEAVRSTEIKLPEEPEPVKKPEKSEDELKAQIRSFEDYDRRVSLEKEIEDDTAHLKDLDSIVKALSGKGEIRTKIVETYLTLFEELANKSATGSGEAVKFRFSAEDGVKVYADFHGDYLPYESLSGGERAFFIYVVMDVLASLTGTNILILDELSVMDSETLTYFIEILIKNAGKYGNIFIAGVDYSEMKQVLVDAGVNILAI